MKSAFVQPDSFAPCTLCVFNTAVDALTLLPVEALDDLSDAKNPPELSRNKIQISQSIELRKFKLRLIDDRFISLYPFVQKLLDDGGIMR